MGKRCHTSTSLQSARIRVRQPAAALTGWIVELTPAWLGHFEETFE